MPSSSSTPTRKPARILLACAVAVAALAIGLVVFFQGRNVPGLQQIPRKDLVLRDGLLHREGDRLPFTGVATDAYGSGERKSQSLISNGLPEGLSIGYHTNGLIQVEEHFHAGVSHGIRTKWHENGNKLSTVMIVDGKLEGVFQTWHPDGTLAERVELKDGVPDGLSRAWYPSGFLKAEVRLQEGEIIDKQYWEDGEYRLEVATAE
jgi:antitoxin component YwqK of YwqJK toxin-antitoxin module